MGPVIFFFIRTVAGLYSLLPVGLQTATGRGLGRLMEATGMRRKVIEQNLELAFPTSPEKRASLFREAYAHLGQLSFEILLLLAPAKAMKRMVLKRSELRGLENWQNAKKLGKGVIFLSSHVGNWEIMAATGALHGGMDLIIVTKHLKPEWLHQAIEKGRGSCGVGATYEPKTLKDVLRHLGRNGTVGFVLDQYAGPPVGVRVPVFGTPVGTTSAVAMLARRTGAQVLPVVNFRTGDGRYVTEVRPPVEFEKDEDATLEIGLNTARYASILEKDIYAYPEQWLWIHRRFKGDLSPLKPDEWREKRVRQ